MPADLTSFAGADDARARAAGALRRLGHTLMAHEAGDDLLERVEAAATRVADMLDQAPPRERDLIDLKRRMFDQEIPDGALVSHFDECFVSGSQNPLGIAIRVRREGDEVVAEVELGPAFEGAPGRSHGGIVAAVFDDVLGYVPSLIRTPAFTGELTIRYLAPTPIGEPLVFRGRLVGRDGRKLQVEGEACREGSSEVVASARATFVVFDPKRLRA